MKETSKSTKAEQITREGGGGGLMIEGMANLYI